MGAIGIPSPVRGSTAAACAGCGACQTVIAVPADRPSSAIAPAGTQAQRDRRAQDERNPVQPCLPSFHGKTSCSCSQPPPAAAPPAVPQPSLWSPRSCSRGLLAVAFPRRPHAALQPPPWPSRSCARPQPHGLGLCGSAGRNRPRYRCDAVFLGQVCFHVRHVACRVYCHGFPSRPCIPHVEAASDDVSADESADAASTCLVGPNWKSMAFFVCAGALAASATMFHAPSAFTAAFVTWMPNTLLLVILVASLLGPTSTPSGPACKRDDRRHLELERLAGVGHHRDLRRSLGDGVRKRHGGRHAPRSENPRQHGARQRPAPLEHAQAARRQILRRFAHDRVLSSVFPVAVSSRPSSYSPCSSGACTTSISTFAAEPASLPVSGSTPCTETVALPGARPRASSNDSPWPGATTPDS